MNLQRSGSKQCLFSVLLSASLLYPSALCGQQPSAPHNDQDDVVRVTVNLVQIDVTVTDSKGRPVTDLNPEDFEILEEGRPQKLTNFSYVTPPTSLASVAQAPVPLSLPTTDNKKSNAKILAVPAPVPAANLRPEKVRRTIALVVDDLGLSHESSVRVRQALKKFVDEQVLPGDLVAVIRTGAGMGALQQFTTDARLLYAAIDRVRYNLGSRSDISTFAPVGSDGIAAQLNDSSLAIRYGGGQDKTRDERGGASFTRLPGQEINQFREELFSVGTLGALNFIVRGLRDLPGRKSVVLFSDGFKMYSEDPGNRRVLDNLQRLTDLANRASVVFYTIDPRGVQYLGMTAADNMNSPLGTLDPTNEKPVDTSKMSDETIARLGGEDAAAAYAKRSQLKPADPFFSHLDNIEQAINDRRTNFFETQQGLSYLATQTGGFLVKNNNDLGGALRRVLNDQAGFYLLGYRPQDPKSLAADGTRRFHNISVTVKRPGVHVRTRKGFYGFTDEEAKRPVRRTASEQLFAALTSPFNSGAIALRMTALFGYDPQRGPFTQSLLHINASDLNFTRNANGMRDAVIDIMAVTFGDNGKVIDQDDRAYAIHVADNEFEQVNRAGLVYIVTLPIKKPGAYQLRIAVRDQATQRVGSANQFIDVPDLKKGRLTLSGISLRGVIPSSTANTSAQMQLSTTSSTNAFDAKDPQPGPAARRMRAGMVLNYAYFIYNAQLDKSTRSPHILTQVRLFRDGQMIYAGRLNNYELPAKADLKQLTAGGTLKLGSSLEPGEYVLQVVAVDRLAKDDRQLATQWIDFEIMNK